MLQLKPVALEMFRTSWHTDSLNTLVPKMKYSEYRSMKSHSRLLTGRHEQYRPCVFFFSFFFNATVISERVPRKTDKIWIWIRAAQWPAMTETDGFGVFNFLNNKIVNGWGFDLYIHGGLQSSGTDLTWISRESRIWILRQFAVLTLFFFFESQYVYITCVAYNDLDTEHFCSLGQGILNELRLMFFFFVCQLCHWLWDICK